MTEHTDLTEAARATNRALDAYVMGRVAGVEDLHRLRAELNAAFRTQYDADRASSRFHVGEDRATELVAEANQRAESIAQRLMAAQRYATDKGDLELAQRLAIPEPHSLETS